MAATGDRLESARIRAVAAVDDYAAELRRVDGARLGEGLIETRALKDRVEAVFAEGLRRFDQSGEYAADGAIDLVAWLRSKCKLWGRSAAGQRRRPDAGTAARRPAGRALPATRRRRLSRWRRAAAAPDHPNHRRHADWCGGFARR